MRWILYAAAADPAMTGLFMLASPWLFGQLILGADFSGPALALGRIGGAAMFALGLASWPSSATATPAFRALLIFNVLATLYLGYLGGAAKMEGVLLWPAVTVHAALAILLALGWLVTARSHRATRWLRKLRSAGGPLLMLAWHWGFSPILAY